MMILKPVPRLGKSCACQVSSRIMSPPKDSKIGWVQGRYPIALVGLLRILGADLDISVVYAI